MPPTVWVLQKRIIPSILIALLVATALVPASPGHAIEPPDRHAEYAGFGTIDHGLNDICQDPPGPCDPFIPSGIAIAECDTKPLAPAEPTGIAGVLFCEIPAPALLNLHIHDNVIEGPTARISCLKASPGTAPPTHQQIAVLDTQGEITLPEGCVNHPSEASDTTRIGVLLKGPPTGNAATHGSVHMDFL